MKRLLLLVAASALAACVPDEGPMMEPGEDCVECHSEGEGKDWTAAGTIFATAGADEGAGVMGARIHITDANGKSLTLRSNEAGNFYTAESLKLPLHVEVEGRGQSHDMEIPATYGGCNRCHTLPPTEDAPGRVSLSGDEYEGGGDDVPGED